MGMHFGVLASEVGSRELVERIGSFAPTMSDGEPLASRSLDVDLRSLAQEDGFDLIAGDLDGRGVILDPSFLLSGGEPDLIARLARDTGKLVIGVCAETVSGSFYCVVARADQVLRHHYQCNMELDQAYSQGEPFASEREHPIDDIDGNGLWAILRAHRLDFARWSDTAPKRRVLWRTEAMSVVEAGPLARAVDAHRAAHTIPPGRRRLPQVVVRHLPDGSVGFDMATGQNSAKKKPWWRFW